MTQKDHVIVTQIVIQEDQEVTQKRVIQKDHIATQMGYGVI